MSILLQSKVSEIDLCVHFRSRLDVILPVFIPKRRLSPKTATVAEFAVFGDSRRFRWQCGQGFRLYFCCLLATFLSHLNLSRLATIVAENGDYSCQCGQATVAVFGVSRRLQRQCGQGFRLYFCRISGHTSVALLPACICGQSSAAIWFLLRYSVKRNQFVDIIYLIHLVLVSVSVF